MSTTNVWDLKLILMDKEMMEGFTDFLEMSAVSFALLDLIGHEAGIVSEENKRALRNGAEYANHVRQTLAKAAIAHERQKDRAIFMTVMFAGIKDADAPQVMDDFFSALTSVIPQLVPMPERSLDS